jgi:uncharacterized protein YceK
MRKTLWQNVAIILAILLVLAGITSCSRHVAPKAEFTVIYSNDVLGETEPCG